MSPVLNYGVGLISAFNSIKKKEKMKNIIVTALLSMALIGCTSTRYQVSEPTATPEAIKALKEEMKDVADMSVSDEGVLIYNQWAGNGYRWSKGLTLKSAYEFSCNQALSILEQGFTISLNFKGSGGGQYNYDLQRCLDMQAEKEQEQEL